MSVASDAPPLTVAAIEAGIRAGVAPVPMAGETVKRAAVAIVLRERTAVPGAEVLLIRRAEREGDPWSGHAAFPGGRADPEDPSIEATAAREAREEVGLELAGALHVGRLPDFPARAQRRWIGMGITPVVFALARDADPPLTLDAREVAAARWVPLRSLTDGRAAGRFVHWWRPFRRVPLPVPLVLPCWRLEGLLVWGLTHRILRVLLETGRRGVAAGAGLG